MKIVFVVPPKNFKDETLSEAQMMFKKWGVETHIASGSNPTCVGNHGAVVKNNMKYTDIKSSDFDAIFLIDGPGVEEYGMNNSRQLIDIIKHFNENNRFIIAIKDSIQTVARANIINNKKIAHILDPETVRLVKLFKGVITDNEIEHDEFIFTSSTNRDVYALSKLVLDKMGVT